MIFTSRNYAIGRAHFQIAGGIRTLLLLAATYIGAVVTVLGLFVYNEAPADAYRALAALVMVIEAFVLVVIGSVRVGGCLRTDVMTHMLDSHRLMPVESWRAVLGYLFGTTVHVQLITLLNVLLLAGLRTQTGLALEDFVINQLVLAIFALFVWSFAAMGSLMVRQIMPIIILGFIFGGIFSISMREFAILPGLSLLASPFLGETIFNLSRGRFHIREVYPLALSAQLAFAALFFIGACRRYRGTYISTFSVLQGMALGLVWAVESVAAISLWTKLGTMRFGAPWRQATLPQQMVAALVVSALLAIVPAHALAMGELRRLGKWWEVVAALSGITLISSVMLAASWSEPIPDLSWKWMLTVLVMGAHALTMYLSLRATRQMSQMARGGLLVTVLFVVWVLPLLVEVGRWILLAERTTAAERSALITAWGSLSPLGLLITQWPHEAPPTPIPGLVFQWLVPVGLWWMGMRLNRGDAASSPPSAEPQPALQGANAVASPSPAAAVSPAPAVTAAAPGPGMS